MRHDRLHVLNLQQKGATMATRIELPKKIVSDAFKQREDSLKRAINTATNELVKTALQDELNQITAAKATITEIK